MTNQQTIAIPKTPTGTQLNCKGWIQEAALRMLLNNLDPAVAERPEDLIVYGGRGKAARNHEALHKIIALLKQLENDETLLVQSGKPVAIMKTHPDAPRVLISNSQLVPNWANWQHFDEEQQELLNRFGRWRLVVRKSEAEGGTVEVAHEALFRTWKRLESWLEPERARLEALRSLQVDAGNWERNAKNQGFLNHRAHRLADARRLSENKGYKKRLIGRELERRSRRTGKRREPIESWVWFPAEGDLRVRYRGHRGTATRTLSAPRRTGQLAAAESGAHPIAPAPGE